MKRPGEDFHTIGNATQFNYLTQIFSNETNMQLKIILKEAAQNCMKMKFKVESFWYEIQS